MTVDQQIQIWNAVGTWLAAFATFGAVVVSLWLATRSERVRLRTSALSMQIIAGDGSEPEPCVIVNAVNLNERPVTITSFSWRIGKGKKARYCMQNVAGRYSSKIPIVLAHGEEARFMISLPEAPAWPADMALFVDDLGESNLKTLRALLFTSVGQTVEVPVDTKVCKLIATADPATASEHAKRRGAPTRSNPAAPASADT